MGNWPQCRSRDNVDDSRMNLALNLYHNYVKTCKKSGKICTSLSDLISIKLHMHNIMLMRSARLVQILQYFLQVLSFYHGSSTCLLVHISAFLVKKTSSLQVACFIAVAKSSPTGTIPPNLATLPPLRGHNQATQHLQICVK